MSMEVLSTDLGNKMQMCIQGYNKRPYGVGMLIAAYDEEGPHIVQICPSANFYPCKAMAIGARSQSARTYLEKHLDEFSSADLDTLVLHGLRALRDTLPNEVDLNNRNVSVACVGKGRSFAVHEGEEVDAWLAAIEGEERRGGHQAPAQQAAQQDGDESGGAAGTGGDDGAAGEGGMETED